MREVLREVGERCHRGGLTAPSRATIYKLLLTLPGPEYRAGNLPESVQRALYNLAPESIVPGRQVAFYCFNYGDLPALSFAAGLPWIALYQALRMPGYRKKSRGLIEAVCAARRI